MAVITYREQWVQYRLGLSSSSSVPSGDFVISSRPSCRANLPETKIRSFLKGLSHEIDFKNVDENGQIVLNKGHGWFLNFSEALIFS